MVLYCGSALFVAFVILTVAKSDCVWQTQAEFHDLASSLLPDILLSQGLGLFVTLIGFTALMLEVQPTSKTYADFIDDLHLL